MRHVALVALLAACNAGKPYDVKDTEGRGFRVTCKKTDCAFVDSSIPPHPNAVMLPGRHAGFALSGMRTSRYLAICDAWIDDKEPTTWASNDSDCRIVVCAKDADCPPTTQMPAPMCLNGLCGNPAQPLDETDVSKLCLAGTGPFTRTPDQMRRQAVTQGTGSVCGPTNAGPCTVPSFCRQP